MDVDDDEGVPREVFEDDMDDDDIIPELFEERLIWTAEEYQQMRNGSSSTSSSFFALLILLRILKLLRTATIQLASTAYMLTRAYPVGVNLLPNLP